MKEGSSSQAGKPVVSQFFTKPSDSSKPVASASSSSAPKQSETVKKSTNGIPKHASIISLSDDDADELEILEVAAGAAPPKRKLSETGTSKADEGDSKAKKVKVAPLFERTKGLPAVKREEGTAASAAGSAGVQDSLNRLQQWKFSATPAVPKAASPSKSHTKGTPSSSPLPEVHGVSKADKALEAQRAQVRKRLLGHETSWQRRNENEEDSPPATEPNSASDDDEDEAPLASTSKAKGKGKARILTQDKENIPPSASSRFASFVSAGKDAKDGTAKGKGKKTDAKGKGKAKEAETGVKYTPLEQQVMEIKKQNPDVLLIVEVGYKFKFFGDDAKIASKELNIACFMSQNFYTAMIPEHRLQVHVKRLITAGHKVGVVRQKETAALKKIGDNRNAPFTRELTNLYTSATYVEGLDDDTVTGAPPTFGTLMCICEQAIGGKGSDEKVVFGIVAAQPSTGEVIYDQFEDGFLRAELETRLLHIQPGEIVLQGHISGPTQRVVAYLMTQEATSSGLAGSGRVDAPQKALSSSKAASLISSFYKETAKAEGSSPKKKSKKKKGKTEQIVALSSDDDVDDENETEMAIDLTEEDDTGEDAAPLAAVLSLPEHVIIALAGLLQHLTSFQLQSVFKRPKFFTPFAQRGSMLLNANTIANLEIFRNQSDFKAHHSLFSILDHTKTSFGQRLLRRWVAKPLLQRDQLQERIDAVDDILNSQSYLLGKMRGLMKGLPDLERGLARIHYLKSSPQELVRILSAFQRIGDEFPNLPEDMKCSSIGFKTDLVNETFKTLPKIHPVIKVFVEQINLTRAREGSKADFWKKEYEPEEVTDCKDLLEAVEAEFVEHLKECRKLLKKPGLEYITVAQEEYLLEVRISESKIVPANWARINGTKVAYRYRSPRMQTLLEQRDQANERLAAEANNAFLAFLSAISAQYEAFRDVVVKLATIDCLLSLSIVALLPGYVKPNLVDDPCLKIVGGRHPMVETASEKQFIPNDVVFADDGLRAMVITGCNMSGKSSYSRMVALLVIMAQIGCYLPCQSANIGIVDYVGTRFGASDEISRGRSTFMVELTETCEILKAATARSLIVLDELGRGTSTNDGLAIAHAVLQYIVKRLRCQTLFITHFPQLAELAARYPTQCQLFQMAYIEERGINGIPDITFLYKLVPGLTDRVHGISCARMAGLPERVCQIAAEKSEALEHADQKLVRDRRTAQLHNLVSQLSQAESANTTQVIQLAKKLVH